MIGGRLSASIVAAATACAVPTSATAPAANALAVAPSSSRPAPRRIVSVNLCTDQLVLALADRSQIAGLTRNAADPDMSSQAVRARGLPILRSSAEEILAARPDLVIGMPASGLPAMRLLSRLDYPIVDIASAIRVEDIYVSITQTAAAVGHPRRGAAMEAAMRKDLARTPRPGRGRVAAYYQRRGFMTGTGTLIDDLMNRVGLLNLATKLGKPVLAQLSLEEMVAAQPAFIIVDSSSDKVTDQGTEMLHHPALRGIPRIRLAEAWTVCGGPAYAIAARSMAEQIMQHDRTTARSR